MSIPSVYSTDSQIYMCVKHNIIYKENTDSKEKLREVCSCYQTLMRLIEWEENIYSHPISYGTNTLIIWDTTFLVNYILPLIREDKKREIIEYTLSHANDNSFKNIIDYDNKVIINDKIYYYPMNIKTCISIRTVDYEWFKTIVPENSWIYKPDCFDDGEGMQTSVLIPLLDKKNKHRVNNTKLKEK
jgi:hypothetical protein